MMAYTDYPFIALGDEPYKPAPIRKVKITSFDGDKFCKVYLVDFVDTEMDYNWYIKTGYLYKHKGRCGEVKCVDKKELAKLIRNKSQRRAYRKQLFKTRNQYKDFIVKGQK
jgi:hypothetical protein